MPRLYAAAIPLSSLGCDDATTTRRLGDFTTSPRVVDFARSARDARSSDAASAATRRAASVRSSDDGSPAHSTTRLLTYTSDTVRDCGTCSLLFCKSASRMMGRILEQRDKPSSRSSHRTGPSDDLASACIVRHTFPVRASVLDNVADSGELSVHCSLTIHCDHVWVIPKGR